MLWVWVEPMPGVSINVIDFPTGYAANAQDYIAKGGEAANVDGRMCLCNGLLAAAGMAQSRRDAGTEAPILTLGDEVGEVLRALSPGARPYHACDVVSYIVSGQEALVPGGTTPVAPAVSV